MVFVGILGMASFVIFFVLWAAYLGESLAWQDFPSERPRIERSIGTILKWMAVPGSIMASCALFALLVG